MSDDSAKILEWVTDMWADGKFTDAEAMERVHEQIGDPS